MGACLISSQRIFKTALLIRTLISDMTRTGVSSNHAETDIFFFYYYLFIYFFL